MKEYSEQQLKEAFELVQPTTHWKDRIDTIVSADQDIALICYAVGYYAYIPAEAKEMPNGDIRITAAGYWASESILEAEIQL